MGKISSSIIYIGEKNTYNLKPNHIIRKSAVDSVSVQYHPTILILPHLTLTLLFFLSSNKWSELTDTFGNV